MNIYDKLAPFRYVTLKLCSNWMQENHKIFIIYFKLCQNVNSLPRRCLLSHSLPVFEIKHMLHHVVTSLLRIFHRKVNIDENLLLKYIINQ